LEDCGYWWTSDQDEWCDLIGSCGGRGKDCSFSARAVEAAMREEKQSLLEDALRARRRKLQQMAGEQQLSL
jgi:hypothetical protein